MLDVALHLGTLAAVMVYFRQDVGRLAMGAFDMLRMKDTAPRQEALNMVYAIAGFVGRRSFWDWA